MLCDLAGMESSKKSSAVEGPSNDPQRREEAKHINTSLCALGTVVERLSASQARALPMSMGTTRDGGTPYRFRYTLQVSASADLRGWGIGRP